MKHSTLSQAQYTHFWPQYHCFELHVSRIRISWFIVWIPYDFDKPHWNIYERFEDFFIPFFCNRATGPIEGSTGIIWMGPGRAVREFLCAMHDKGGRRKLFRRTKSLFPSGCLRTNRNNKRDRWFCVAPEIKALKYSPNDGFFFTRTTRYEWEYLFYLR
jgi:hypothetical protein